MTNSVLAATREEPGLWPTAGLSSPPLETVVAPPDEEEPTVSTTTATVQVGAAAAAAGAWVIEPMREDTEDSEDQGWS